MAYRKITAAQCRAARGMLKLTIRELAAKADVSVDTIVRLEYGGALMPRTLAAVQQALEAAGVEFGADDGVWQR